MPTRSDWIVFEGRHATRRGAAMVTEARRLFKARTGRSGPRISQGGLSGSVGASANTHLREAFDFVTAGWPASHQKIWEECLWTVGFAAWWRPYVWNLWPEHCHAIPKDGDLSLGARYQVSAFKAKRNGLRSNSSYPRIGKYAFRTWEGYLASKPKPAPPKPLPKVRIAGRLYNDIPYVSLYWLLKARSGKNMSRHVFHVQRWLARLRFYKAPKDGKWDATTQKAYDNFRRSLRYREADAQGPPGWTSLQALAKKAKTVKKIREGK